MARLVDAETDAVIASQVRVADNPWTRFRGLMLAPPLGEGEGLLIKPCGSIHMMFMRFRIDAVFLDRDNRVTAVARSLPRWRGLAFGGRGAKAVIELADGAAADVAVGQVLALVE